MGEYNTGNPVPSSAMPDVWDNNATIDEFVNSPELTLTTRTGTERDTLAGIQKKSDDQRVQMAEDGAAVVEETRKNLIPLSRQYMTLAAAQADIANIPVGSTTYYRSPDDSALAIEVMNVGGTLQPTGRKMPSQKAVDDIAEQTQQATDWLQRIYLGQQIQAETQSQITNDNENAITALQHLSLSLQVISEIIFSQESTLNESQVNCINDNLQRCAQ